VALEGRTLAKRPWRGRAERAVAQEQVLLFRVGDCLGGVGLRGLWEVLAPDGVTELLTPSYQICTALAYRGRKLPLVRMSELFGISAEKVPPTARVLLIQGQGRPLGLLVDEVLGVADINPQRVAPMPVQASLLSPALFRGLFSRENQVFILVSEDGLGGMAEVARFAES
jgi:chemotaxis signal transduction protein